jgi:hypothetical protein
LSDRSLPLPEFERSHQVHPLIESGEPTGVLRRIVHLATNGISGRSSSRGSEAKMEVFDEYLVDPRLSLLDKVRIQAQVLVPVLRALREELGSERANALVRRALRDWSKQLFAAIGDGVDGGPRRKWAAMHTAMARITEQDVAVEMKRHDRDTLEFDITRCAFAEFFRALEEPELGALLVCETDFDIAAAGAAEVRFTRDQTIMRGASTCPFRYRFAPRSPGDTVKTPS